MPKAESPVLAGRYRVLELLGEGAAGRVVLARDLELDRLVAVKLLTGEGTLADPRRFLEEGRALAELDHEGIVKVFEVGLHGDRPYLAMEAVRGGSLAAHLKRGHLPAEHALEVASTLLGALAHAHERGILHRDVKPENVLLTHEGRPKLTDFGLAKNRRSQIRTRTGMLVGTPEFMAPELFQGKAYSAASDLYALGCLVHCVVNGAPPFLGDLGELVRAASTGRFPVRRLCGPLRAFVERTVIPDPGKRAGVAELRRLLEGDSPPDLRATRSVSRSSLGSMAPPPPAPPGRRSALGWAGALMVLPAAALLWSARGARPPPPPPASTPELPATRAQRVRDWIRRVRRDEIQGLLARLHRQVDGEHDPVQAEKYQERMDDHRHGRAPNPGVVALARAHEDLPHRADLDRDREALTEALQDRDLPWPLRRDLIESLQLLEDVDEYYSAWGEAPPYRVAPMVATVAPVTVHEVSGEAFETAPGPLPAPLPPGRHALFAWSGETDRTYPTLLPDPSRPSLDQKISFQYARLTIAFEPENHREIRVDFELPPDGPTRGVALILTVGQFTPPDSLRVQLGDCLLRLRPLAARAARDAYLPGGRPEYELRLRPPPEALQAGSNQLVVTAHEPPGLPRFNGTDVHAVELVLAGAPPDGGADTGRPYP